MTPHDAFLQSIVENPDDDDAPRLIYADWLEEHGEPERAAFIRVQCELAALGDHPRVKVKQCSLRWREWELLSAWPAHPRWLGAKRLLADTHAGRLADRNNHDIWLCAEGAEGPGQTIYFAFRRGFAELITCTCQQWLDHGPAILAACPTIREVRLSDKRPDTGFNEARFAWARIIGDDSAFVLPEPIYELLPQKRPRGVRAMVAGEFYDSEERAISDLSQACLAYARSRLPVATNS